ncbi:39S ribosomal protein L34, mitochondrial [Habropoda laboriosa]|uniref:Large ribosomal subunit protein bL34m n=1 Tax=Habropoda laboriosa TaxID=597456 RepID=A0A0L7RBL3_9HYME|nr:39S ribosomal protein L34, mitochondrial [Habropoda laboriosa]
MLIFRRLVSLGQACSSILTPSTITNPWSLILSRGKMRYHFPHPSERLRIKRHGWEARMSTPNGRKILMRRILKGKYVLAH